MSETTEIILIFILSITGFVVVYNLDNYVSGL